MLCTQRLKQEIELRRQRRVLTGSALHSQAPLGVGCKPPTSLHLLPGLLMGPHGYL